MSLKRIEITATYNNLTSIQIEALRDEKISLYYTEEITGVMIVGEGNLWMAIEGDETTADAEVESLSLDSRFQDFDVPAEGAINSRKWSKCYSYYELETPKAT
ncbi:MAG: BLUF domain-containing protein [Bradymonadaceae bacterium]|nr:BLUF domain-containing protein [Lujinxingiaceae bacterium]